MRNRVRTEKFEKKGEPFSSDAAAPPLGFGRPPRRHHFSIGEEEETGERREYFLVRKGMREKQKRKMNENGSYTLFISPTEPTHIQLDRPSFQPTPTRPSKPVQQGPTCAFCPFFIFLLSAHPLIAAAPPRCNLIPFLRFFFVSLALHFFILLVHFHPFKFIILPSLFIVYLFLYFF